MLVAGLWRRGGDAGGRKSQGQRFPHVGIIGREKEMGAQRTQIAEGIVPLREYAPLDGVESVRSGGAEDSHAADRIVAREQDDLDSLVVGGVETEQLAHQGECDSGGCRIIDVRELGMHVGAGVTGFEQSVFGLEIEQGTRGNGDDKLAVQGCGHATGMVR